jgi:DNA-binding response OmpR family regulator
MAAEVLIIDDDQSIRDSLRKLLTVEGYSVREAADAAGGVAAFRAAEPNLVLLDLNLAADNGWDVFEELTATDPYVPIVIITGRDEQERFAESAGVGALVEKPIDVPFLLRTITRLLAEPRAHQIERLLGDGREFRHAVAVDSSRRVKA